MPRSEGILGLQHSTQSTKQFTASTWFVQTLHDLSRGAGLIGCKTDNRVQAISVSQVLGVKFSLLCKLEVLVTLKYASIAILLIQTDNAL